MDTDFKWETVLDDRMREHHPHTHVVKLAVIADPYPDEQSRWIESCNCGMWRARSISLQNKRRTGCWLTFPTGKHPSAVTHIKLSTDINRLINAMGLTTSEAKEINKKLIRLAKK